MTTSLQPMAVRRVASAMLWMRTISSRFSSPCAPPGTNGKGGMGRNSGAFSPPRGKVSATVRMGVLARGSW